MHCLITSMGCWVHRRSVRAQPGLFVLSMEVLNALILQAEEEQLFLPLGNSGIIFRASFYADDTVIFIKPARQDLLLLLSIMEAFEQISGLRTNKEKSKATPINCSAEETQLAVAIFGCAVVDEIRLAVYRGICPR